VKGYSLIIPSWYPTKESPVNGIFIFKHIQVISQFAKVMVLYATIASAKQVERLRIEEGGSNGFDETIVYYKASSSRLLNQFILLHAFLKGFLHIKKKIGLPTVVHNHVVFPAGLFAFFISKLFRIPLLITEHWSGYTPEDGRYRRMPLILRSLIALIFKEAKAISVVSSYLMRSLLYNELITPKSKVLIVSNVLTKPNNFLGKKFKEKSAAEALCIANLNDHEKNISGLIDAIAEVVKTFPEFILTLVGSSPEQKFFEQYAENRNLLNKNILFTGNIANDKVNDYYQANDFFILNSNFETFSIASAEALINGLPVIVTRCGGPEEFVNANNGILVQKNDSQELAMAIKTMIMNYSNYNALWISKNILAQYSHEEVLGGMKNLYAFILSPTNPLQSDLH
jgi:L-malate glycosyltransferase